MACTFMLRVLLYRSESNVDDLSLWLFAVKHAACLHNRLPNRVTGITPLEILTNVKIDHRGLLTNHVWGYPRFSLEAKLQDNQMIPKWNKRLRLGQFLGY